MLSPLYSSLDICCSPPSSTSAELEDNGLFVFEEKRKCRKLNVKSIGNQKKQKQQHFAQLWPQFFVNNDVSLLSANEYSQKLIPNQMEHSQKSYDMISKTQDDITLSMHMSISDRGQEEMDENVCSSMRIERKVFSESNWNLDEDILVCELHNQIGNNWAYIAAQLQGRNRIEVKTRFRSITRAAKRHWTIEQDDLLRHLFVNQYDKVWSDDIASHFHNRTKTSVKSHLKKLMEGSLIDNVYPTGSPINVLIQRPDLHQLIIDSSKSSLVSMSRNKSGEAEEDGSCQSAAEDEEVNISEKPIDPPLWYYSQEMTPSTHSKITMKDFSQGMDAGMISSHGYEHIEPMNLSHPTLKQQQNEMTSNKRKRIDFDEFEIDMLIATLSD